MSPRIIPQDVHATTTNSDAVSNPVLPTDAASHSRLSQSVDRWIVKFPDGYLHSYATDRGIYLTPDFTNAKFFKYEVGALDAALTFGGSVRRIVLTTEGPKHAINRFRDRLTKFAMGEGKI